jgi:copper homeostasis protein
MAICEVCVEGLAGVRAAEVGGAHRVELCAGLVEGGTTPSSGTVALALERVGIDIVVLVRPRGGDFLYTDEEFDTMVRDVEAVRAAGAFGVATGALAAGGRIDVQRTTCLVAAARPMQVTFHRAFDMTRDPREALETLMELGVDRVLTSGQRRSVPEGLELIRELVDQAGNRIVVMPGCGIQEDNLREVLEVTGAQEVHFTAFRSRESEMGYRNPDPVMGASRLPGEYELQVTDPERVREFLRQAELASSP